MTNDPFSDPTEIPNTHPSAMSFVGRLVLIKVTNYEANLPDPSNTGKFINKVTADVTTVDSLGGVELFPKGRPSGQFLEGPVFPGVWFSQTRIVPALTPNGARDIGRVILTNFSCFKPGQPIGQGNPYSLEPASEEQKAQARKFLAEMAVGGAAAPAKQLTPAPAPAANPFA